MEEVEKLNLSGIEKKIFLFLLENIDLTVYYTDLLLKFSKTIDLKSYTNIKILVHGIKEKLINTKYKILLNNNYSCVLKMR
jgi:hypothetical protein